MKGHIEIKKRGHNMIYQYHDSDGIEQIDVGSINSENITVAYVSKDELGKLNEQLGFDDSTVERCNDEPGKLRSVAEVYDDYIFGILHVVTDLASADDWIGIYVRRNLLVIVDILDEDKSTEEAFTRIVEKLKSGKASIEKLTALFFDSLCSDDAATIEGLEARLEELETSLVESKVDEDYNLALMNIKKQLQRLHNYFDHMLDIAQAVHENENYIFDASKLIYVNNLIHKVERLNEDTVNLRSTVEHLQDAYFSYLDMKLNSTMKVLTVISSIFFPLTIIVGWYGMNFTTMPELTWKFGYLYVIVLSAAVVISLILVGKRKKLL